MLKTFTPVWLFISLLWIFSSAGYANVPTNTNASQADSTHQLVIDRKALRRNQGPKTPDARIKAKREARQKQLNEGLSNQQKHQIKQDARAQRGQWKDMTPAEKSQAKRRYKQKYPDFDPKQKYEAQRLERHEDNTLTPQKK